MGTYAFYVYGSYGFAALVVLALVCWVWLDGAARRKELALLEAAGARRASAGASAKAGHP